MGTRYFHSRFRIWSIRRRGKVHFIHISRKTTKKAFPKNHTNPGMDQALALSSASGIRLVALPETGETNNAE